METPDADEPDLDPWELCQQWADALVTLHHQRLTNDRTVPDEELHARFAPDGHHRPVVVLLLAAALLERIRALGLTGRGIFAVPLAAPRHDGVTGTLQRGASAALSAAPAVGEAREALLRWATGDGPDERRLWDTVVDAAADVADATARGTRPWYTGPRHPAAIPDGRYWERGICMADVVLQEQQRVELASVAALFDED